MKQSAYYDPNNSRKYRKLVGDLREHEKTARSDFQVARGNGDHDKAKEILHQATVRVDEYEALLRSLTAEEVLLAGYGVDIIEESIVLFVMPAGSSRMHILEKAESRIREREGRSFFHPDWFEPLRQKPELTQIQDTSKRLCIHGHVQGGDGKTRREQEAFLGNEFSMPQIEDLAVAFALHWVAMGEPLFGWHDRSREHSFIIRAVGGSLGFSRLGLGKMLECYYGDDYRGNNMGVSVLVSQ